ncbi:MAG: hypothetical protein NW214_13725 [Pseudanabaenaceae cyanobacterium bins.39]|nr:hypothetical protein [Pseudanabaenaceae cyanobacterium bins.39]
MSAIANSNHPEDKSKTSKTSYFGRNHPWLKLTSLLVAIALCFTLTACGGGNKNVTKTGASSLPSVKFTEVSPPSEIQRLSRQLDQYEPKISILSPKADEILNDGEVSVKFDVKDLPIFKNAEFGLGPHIHVALDNQEYKALYDINQAVTFSNLSPGTHTIRAFASRPWHESFKNQGAYAQVSFHVFTKTDENNPNAQTPLLTYSRPVGTYGAEPIMLDFYLQNAPLHLLAQKEAKINDWQIRATIDDQSFVFDRWEPIYLKGFKKGKNWVKLELIEVDGDPIPNVFNSTAHVINYQPDGTDTLSRLVRGEVIANIDAIVNPSYVPPATPAPEPTPEPAKPDETVPVVVPDAKPSAKVETVPVKELGKKEEVKAPTSVIPVVPVTPPVSTPTFTPFKLKSNPKSMPATPESAKPQDLAKPKEVKTIKNKAIEVKPESQKVKSDIKPQTEVPTSSTIPVDLSATTSTPIKVIAK